uniref:Uncharacterized protein n=1 Tax=Arundo donax TaxID=35708 RepID=A0A0A8XZG4_ARUDO
MRSLPLWDFSDCKLA